MARIFVVEDDASLREELMRLLELQGHTALTGTEHGDHGADRDRAHDGDGDGKGTIPEKGCRAHRARHPRSRRGARITPRIPARGA